MYWDYKFAYISRENDGSGVAVVNFCSWIETIRQTDDKRVLQQAGSRWETRGPVIRTLEVSLEGRSDDELRRYLNTILSESVSYTPIPEQVND